MLRDHLFPPLMVALLLTKMAAAHDHPKQRSVTPGFKEAGEYVENKGQWSAQVLYRADFGTLALFAERSQLTWSMWEENVPDQVHELQHRSPEEQAEARLRGHAWMMEFHGSNPNVQVERTGPSSDYFNYFLGNDPSKWASYVRHFSEVRYRSLWPEVDLRLYDRDGAFKYDIELAHGSSVEQVRFSYKGLDGLMVDADGNLVLMTSVGQVVESSPVAWYADGRKEPVECHYHLEGNTIGFRFASGTDLERPIVIDPLLIASTLSGTGNIGTTQNYGHTATYDADGNIYTGAICFGQGYPATPGAFDLTHNGSIDIAVSKLNPTGTALIFATYLGGSSGDYPHSLVVTPSGELTVYGTTASSNYPTANAFSATFNGGTADIVVTKLNTTGTALVGSTYVGTSGSDGRNTLTNNYGDSYRGEILSDAAGRIYIASCTNGANFPTTAGAYQTAASGGLDGVAFCLSPNLSTMVWSTYIGTPGNEMCFGIKLSSTGEPYICGGTSNSTFPTTPGVLQPVSGGGQDAFIVHFNNTATTLLHSTLFGGTGDETAFFIQMDLDDDVFIYGQVENGTLPISPAGTYGNTGGTIFVASLSSDLSTEVFQTVLGPAGGFGASMVPVAFLVDVCDNIYISGYSVGSNWATTAGALYASGGFYLAAYEPDMANIIYGTYYQGAGHVDGGTSRFDANGIVYQAVCTSGPFPTTPGAFSNDQPSSWDVGVFKIDFQVAGVNAAGASTLNQGCAPITIDFSNASTGDTWIWDFGDGSPPVEAFAPSHAYTEAGDYIVTLIAFDSLSCNLADTTYLPITIGQQQPIAASLTWQQVENCLEMQITAQNTSTGTPLDHIWDMGDGTLYLTDEVQHTYSIAGNYSILLIAYDPTGCSDADTVVVPITVAPLEFEFEVPDGEICEGGVTQLDASIIEGNYDWNTGEQTPIITVVDTGTFWVTITNNAGCIGTDTVLVTPAPDLVFNLDDHVLCLEGLAVLDASELPGTYLWNTGSIMSSIIVNGTGSYWVTITDEDGCSGIDTVFVTPAPLYELSVEEITCPGTPVSLSIPFENAPQYLWETGSIEQSILAEGREATYPFAIVDEFGCTHTDSARVILLDADAQLFAPNAFTPNGDGVNDTFLISGFGEMGAQFTIFNRWGELLYSSTDPREGWDGTYNGGIVQNGVYVYELKYTGICDGALRRTIGHVTVIR